MKIAKPSFELLYPVTPEQAVFEMEKIEQAGRTCYKSEATEDSHDGFIRRVMRRGHLSVIEHGIATAKIITDRGITHELVRHRLASYSQESTRYCNYSKGKFGGEISVIEPPGMTDAQKTAWYVTMLYLEEKYMNLLHLGCSPEIARSVLPTALKAEIIVTANLREWQHIFTLRTSAAAHPQIREVMRMGLAQMKKLFPPIFENIKEAEHEND